MENGLYTAHDVAIILANAFGDDCACNFNGNDEWLPYLCELQDGGEVVLRYPTLLDVLAMLTLLFRRDKEIVFTAPPKGE